MKRAIPDVSFDADPVTGVAVYSSYVNGTANPWAQVGGTSFSAPAWGSVVAIIDQARAIKGLGTLDGASQTLPMLYNLSRTTASAFHDVVQGNNGFATGTGYDLVTGLGSPIVDALVTGLTSTTTSTSKLVIQSTPTAGTAGRALATAFTVAIQNQSGQVVTTDNSIVTLTIASGPGNFTTTSTVSVRAVNGIAKFTNLVLNTAGTYHFRVSDGSYTGATSGNLTVTPAQAAKVIFQSAPSNGTLNQALASVSVAVVDSFGNVVTTNSSTVTIAVASGPSSLGSNSTTSVRVTNGVATFSRLVLATAGTYTLIARDTGLTSATSSSFMVGVGLSAPQNVTLVALSSTTARLTWNSVVGAQGYRVYQVAGNQSFLLGSLGSTATAVQITGIPAGSQVSFKIQAFNATNAADSQVVSLIMPATKVSASTLLARVSSSIPVGFAATARKPTQA